MLPSRPRPARAGGRSGARVFPGFQVGQRVDRGAAFGVPTTDPDLEVEVRRGRVPRLPGPAGLLACGDGLAAGGRERTFLAAGEEQGEADRAVLGHRVD